MRVVVRESCVLHFVGGAQLQRVRKALLLKFITYCWIESYTRIRSTNVSRSAFLVSLFVVRSLFRFIFPDTFVLVAGSDDWILLPLLET